MNVPKLRFKEFSGEWEEKSLGKLGSFSKGGTLSKAELSDAGTECILYGELYTNYGEVANFVKSKTNVDEKLLTYSIKYDVVLPSSGETPEDISTATCLLKDNIALGGDLIVYRSDKLDGRFTSYLLNHKCKMKIAKIAQGKSVVHINSNALKKITVNYPNKDEQEKLVCFIRFIESKIENIQLQIECLEKQKKSLMQKIFRQELRFKDEDGKEFPVWEEKFIKEICSISTGKSNTQDKVDSGAYPFYVRSSVVEKSEKYLYDEEAVLTVGDGVGTGKIYHYINGKYDLHQRVYRMYDFVGVIAKYFYFYFSSHFYDRVSKMSAKNSVDSVRLNMIADMKISVPCMDEQSKIVELLTCLERKLNISKEVLEHWQQIKKGLLQKMFV